MHELKMQCCIAVILTSINLLTLTKAHCSQVFVDAPKLKGQRCILLKRTVDKRKHRLLVYLDTNVGIKFV